jgi:predicted transcriptional regulator
LFEAVVSEQEARRGEVRGLLRRAFDGAMAPMLGFLLEHEKLSAEELRRLREMIDRAQRGERGP